MIHPAKQYLLRNLHSTPDYLVGPFISGALMDMCRDDDLRQ